MTHLNLTHRIYIGFDFERPIRVWGYEFLKETVELRFFILIYEKGSSKQNLDLCQVYWMEEPFFIFRLFLFIKEIYE